MYPQRSGKILIFICFLILSICAGCGAKNGSPSGSDEKEGSRPADPVVYTPEAPGSEVIGTDALKIDISNRTDGYVMAQYTGDAAKANIQITGEDGVAYKYFLTPSDSFIPLPLSAGSGSYQIDGYENISDNKYAVLFYAAHNTDHGFSCRKACGVLAPRSQQFPERQHNAALCIPAFYSA